MCDILPSVMVWSIIVVIVVYIIVLIVYHGHGTSGSNPKMKTIKVREAFKKTKRSNLGKVPNRGGRGVYALAGNSQPS